MKKLLCNLHLSGVMEIGDHFKNGRILSHTIKGIMLPVILLIMSSYLVMGQSNAPIIGYDKVTWGATIQEVQKFYPNITEKNLYDTGHHSLEISQMERGCSCIRVFNEIIGSNGIKSRTFYFFQDKLYRVHVRYDINLEFSLRDKLISVYGKNQAEEDNIVYQREYSKNLIVFMVTRMTDCLVMYFDNGTSDGINDVYNKKREKEREAIKL